MNSRHCSGLYLRSLLPSDPRLSYKHWVHLVLWRTAQNLFGGSEMLSLSQCRPEDEQFCFILRQFRSLMRSETSFCVIVCAWAEVTFKKNSKSLEVDGCGVSTGVSSSSSSHSREKLSEGSGISRPSQWGTGQMADGTFGYSTHHFFFLVIPFWIGDNIQK
jgi:hypothetical protein